MHAPLPVTTGMLVQKRTDSVRLSIPPPTIRVRVKYGSTYHEINICSQATFGELKKILSRSTGLHYQDQKLIYNWLLNKMERNMTQRNILVKKGAKKKPLWWMLTLRMVQYS